MNPSCKELSAELASKGIRSSFQRIKVLEYLVKNQYHPTVDQIYKDLKNEIPTLSKTTIYNTLDHFIEAGLIRVLAIEDNETRYDIVTETHGHFKCRECGSIFNFSANMDSLVAEELSGFKIIDRDVYFKGFCPKCLININDNLERSK